MADNSNNKLLQESDTVWPPLFERLKRALVSQDSEQAATVAMEISTFLVGESEFPTNVFDDICGVLKEPSVSQSSVVYFVLFLMQNEVNTTFSIGQKLAFLRILEPIFLVTSAELSRFIIQDILGRTYADGDALGVLANLKKEVEDNRMLDVVCSIAQLTRSSKYPEVVAQAIHMLEQMVDSTDPNIARVSQIAIREHRVAYEDKKQ